MAMNPFDDPQAVATYAEQPPKLVPGFADLQRMCMLLMAERAPQDARVLVLGAGGGLELDLFARTHARWQFDGVDPSAEMLRLARNRVQAHSSRVRLHHGYIYDAPSGPFDAACSLLTLHFIAREERLRTLVEVRHRMRPGAPFVAAHFSFPQEASKRERWFLRNKAFAIASGIAPDNAERARAGISSQLPILSPEEDESLLRNSGFTDVELFYAAFGFRGWVASA